MGRPRKNMQINVGGKFEPALATKFKNLAQANGVSMHEALRRVMSNAILTGRVPGIEALDIERREHEKYGAATPVYDGQQEKTVTGKVETRPHAE
jgi:hypothetical protein